jgi:hypothetical protein
MVVDDDDIIMMLKHFLFFRGDVYSPPLQNGKRPREDEEESDKDENGENDKEIEKKRYDSLLFKEFVLFCCHCMSKSSLFAKCLFDHCWYVEPYEMHES